PSPQRSVPLARGLVQVEVGHEAAAADASWPDTGLRWRLAPDPAVVTEWAREVQGSHSGSRSQLRRRAQPPPRTRAATVRFAGVRPTAARRYVPGWRLARRYMPRGRANEQRGANPCCRLEVPEVTVWRWRGKRGRRAPGLYPQGLEHPCVRGGT